MEKVSVVATRQLSDGGKAQRVYLLLSNEILRGGYAPGDVLPGEIKLTEMHSVSRVTIRRALTMLANDGLIERKAGLGTVVRAPAMSQTGISADFASLMPQLVRMGQATEARLISFAYVAPPAPVAKLLRLESGNVQRAVRVRTVEGAPFSHLMTHVPEDIAQNFSEADLATTPLFRLLERSGVIVDHAQQSISATLAAPDVAEALDVAVGTALIALTRVVYDKSGRGVEHLSALYRPDRFRLDMTLNRIGHQGERQWASVLEMGGNE
ncbi:GntR family transcriptional regulator [Rhizobium sp. EC-SD404]|uniref:GntR family transcriptional regulator n=1 Tax=Rhizobium sp. EC-SD404 TaxID=2038389 RepID=UPI001253273C|nr:GntR family transcriptional regulator [Rhizobium sp. EC-SD404]VVT26816.1 GntR family transcriptional regulator [Rhizobium sp. EC-SD404]